MRKSEKQASLLDEELRIEKAWEEEAEKLLKKDIDEALVEYDYTNRGEAFVHVFVRYYLNVEDEEAGDACQVGRGGRDKGIDAIYADQRAKLTYLVAGTLESKSFGPDVLEDIRRAREFLSSPSPGNVKKDLISAWDYYKEHLDKGFSTKYVMAILGTLNNEAKGALEKMSVEFKKEAWDIEVLERPDVLTAISMPMRLVRGPDAEFSLVGRPLEYAPKGLPKGLVATIEGGELAKLVLQKPQSVFALNLREYLGPKSIVNKSIEDTTRKQEKRKLFWYLNLGVDAICDTYKIARPSRTRPRVLRVKNLRIVNGRQTCAVLSRFPTEARECSLMLRLVQAPKTEFAGEIAVARNRQNPIKGRDLFAHDSVQLLLEQQARMLDKPFFYERREREWVNVKDRLRYRTRFGKRVIRNDQAAKAYVSTMYQDPFKAKHRFFSYIFLSKENNGFYEDIFGPDLRIEDLIIADELFQVAENMVRDKRRLHRDLTKKSEKEKLSPQEEGDLRTLSYLFYADTYLAALAWYLLQKHLVDKEKIKTLITFDRPLDPDKTSKLERMCELASKSVVDHLSNLDQEFYRKKGLRFNARNFFAREDSYELLKATADRWIDYDDVVRATS
jgi:hypothetical protein